MTCPACGADTREGIAFCEECGEGLLIIAPCGHPNRPGLAFCEECGEPLTPKDPESEPDLPASPAPPLTPAPDDVAGACGHVNRPGVAFCEECGEPIEMPAPDRRRVRAWQIAAAVVVIGGSAGAFAVLRPSGPPTPEELVNRLPEPAEVATCSDLSDTARDFIRAAAAVAVDDPSLVSDVDRFGTGYSGRMSGLGCSDDDLLAGVRAIPPPGEGASAAELVEYFLTGINVTYPEAPVDSVSTGGNP